MDLNIIKWRITIKHLKRWLITIVKPDLVLRSNFMSFLCEGNCEIRIMTNAIYSQITGIMTERDNILKYPTSTWNRT